MPRTVRQRTSRQPPGKNRPPGPPATGGSGRGKAAGRDRRCSLEPLAHAAQDARDTGLTVEVGGDALQTVPETGSTEVIGVVVAAVVLVITLGSLIAPGLPLVSALFGVGIGYRFGATE